MGKMKLETYAAYMLNRDVTQQEAAKAAGYKSRSTFGKHSNDGTLPMEAIKTACEHWGLDATTALIRMGYLPEPEGWESPGKVVTTTRKDTSRRSKVRNGYRKPM